MAWACQLPRPCAPRDAPHAAMHLPRWIISRHLPPDLAITPRFPLLQLGNSYTASVWQGLASLVWRRGDAGLAGRRLLLFSFGSGTLAALLGFVARGCSAGSSSSNGSSSSAAASNVKDGSSGCHGNGDGAKQLPVAGGGNGDGPAFLDPGPRDPRFTLESIQRVLDLDARLAARVVRSVADFNGVAAQVEASYRCPLPYTPVGDLAAVGRGVYYLAAVDELGRRRYERK